MCSLQEHIERDIRARKAAAEAAAAAAAAEPRPEWCGRIQVPVAPAKAPYTFEAPEIDKAAEELGAAIHQVVRERTLRRAADIEMHFAIGLMLGIGVRIKDYADGSYEIAVDATVPDREIYEERPDQPTFGLVFTD